MTIVNNTPTLKDLPPPPSSKSGWPWTEQSKPLPDRMSDGSKWPRISIVTPSYNQGQFIEETIRSVLLQGYPNVEYIIIDGGSTDNSVDVIQKYEQYLAYWVSEPDKGQSHALNKGFHKATGCLIGWQNSDDYYHFQAFRNAAQICSLFKEADILYGSTKMIDVRGNFISEYPVSQFNIESMIPYLNMTNHSMFIRDRVFTEGCFINESFSHAMDLDFFLRLAIKDYGFHYSPEIIGYYREHIDSKSFKQESVCVKECLNIYKSIYLNIELPLSFRKKALLCIRGLCLDNFGKLRLSRFQKSVRYLISIAGLGGPSFGLYFKYLLSYIGVNNVNRIKRVRSAYYDRLLNKP